MASLFDSKGNALGVCDTKGRSMAIPSTSYPITVRYLGFKEQVVPDVGRDTIYMQEIVTSLPEVVVRQGILHDVKLFRHRLPLSGKDGGLYACAG